MKGILLVDKQAGWTSFDVVNYVRKAVAQTSGKKPKQVKAGHSGTLDPFATGLLILLIGKDYTRRAGEFSKLDKTYEVTMELGQISSTGDPEGQLTRIAGAKQPPSQQIAKVLQKFIGEIKQVPPAYSAIKVDGQRAYKLARAGKAVELKPRKVRVESLELREYNYPAVKFIANVSSGTYIRSLVEDIGKELGTGAYTSGLRRTRVGNFSLDKASSIETSDVLHRIFLLQEQRSVNHSPP
jgi:tRNA pseudouridine55 synthase